ncbi:NmrA family NAD(P)-binding protein [Paenibacillus thalictri]|uniref:NmrA family transcriptional regulator n=1 Tax=Paenibacillus thalictri TaxID=2527873 RepID=A0A4Q9DH38_9BACL|nr:NAD(P)H-binding protein [Paenibacillus thalictri]TBL71609.1 NmrA family transcriptional regulator [Paenibacillus thalictri]
MMVLTTPTGQIGRQVLDIVLDSAEAIRLIARDPSRLSPRVRERVEVVQGSHDDIDVVTKAFEGADSVFWVVPPNPRAKSVQDHVLNFIRPVCEAINSQGVKRVVGISSLGRGIAKNAGQISAIFAMDDLIESTGVSYRSLCMPGFMENMLWQVESIKRQGMLFYPMPGDRKVPHCATRDIATVAAKLLLDHSWSGQESISVCGPEDLSFNDMAQIISEVIERPIRFQQVPGETYKATMVQHGMTEAWAQGLIDMAASVDRGIYDAETRTPHSAAPTGFRQWCEEVLKPAVLA